ncbi:MAG: MnmC family methyltransferase [archaeon]
MKPVLTDDGSMTFYSSEFSECYHSKSGALQEAFEKYIKPCKIKDGMVVLDVCFGLGYNSLAALYTAKNLKIIGLEKDINILKQKVDMPSYLEKDYSKIIEASKNLKYKDDAVEIKILVGDALQTIDTVNENFDAVFFDPFSPKKCPELWALDFFKKIRSKMKKGGILATYSCARNVRDNLRQAGFEVKDGPCIGRRSPSTVAFA